MVRFGFLVNSCHLAAWNYFESIDTPANKDFIAKWHEFTKKANRTTNDPMEDRKSTL